MCNFFWSSIKLKLVIIFKNILDDIYLFIYFLKILLGLDCQWQKLSFTHWYVWQMTSVLGCYLLHNKGMRDDKSAEKNAALLVLMPFFLWSLCRCLLVGVKDIWIFLSCNICSLVLMSDSFLDRIILDLGSEFLEYYILSPKRYNPLISSCNVCNCLLILVNGNRPITWVFYSSEIFLVNQRAQLLARPFQSTSWWLTKSKSQQVGVYPVELYWENFFFSGVCQEIISRS